MAKGRVPFWDSRIPGDGAKEPRLLSFLPALTCLSGRLFLCIIRKKRGERMTPEELLARMMQMRDLPYGELQKKLIPGSEAGAYLGVRTPALRALAREAAHQPDTAAFLVRLPHRYFDENQLHAFLLAEEKDFDLCMRGVEAFLPYVDNWATCDQMSPKCFRRHRRELLPYIQRWLHSAHPYTVRFGLGMLMQHFLDVDFDPVYLQWAASVRSDAYYVNMMIAWYFATALAKQYDAALPCLDQLEPWTRNKAIQKALESCRVPEERKAFLKTLKKYEK